MEGESLQNFIEVNGIFVDTKEPETTVNFDMQEKNSEVHAEMQGEEVLHQMEIANARLDIDGSSRFQESWTKVGEWAKEGFDWAKAPSKTYTEAVGKAALFSAGTTVFLAPIFLYRNCAQVYHARHQEESFEVRHA